MKNMIFSAESLIGNTPLVQLKKTKETLGLECNLFAKAEGFNVGGSIKSRVAKAILDDAEKSGKLKKGGTVVEATSGNTGIGLALVAGMRGYKAIIVMPDTMSKERQTLIKAYGGEVVLTDGSLGMKGAVEKAEEICKNTPNSMIAGQFSNPANVQAHYEGTAPELYRQMQGQIDLFVAGVGTGGTLTGVGKYLKERGACQVIAVEPSASPLLSKGISAPHKLQGIGANFIPEILDREVYDEVIAVSDEEAYRFARYLSKEEGLFVGISSGAAFAAAVEIAKRAENKDKNLVVILPDEGGRYLSTDLFEGEICK